MRVTRASVDRSCAICERRLLMGERAVRYSPNGGEYYVDVCPLCQEIATEYGWLKEGSPTTPTIPARAQEEEVLARLAARAAEAPCRGAGGERADPASPLRGGARDRRSREPVQRVAVPAHGRRDREEPRDAKGVGDPPFGRDERRDRDDRVGDLLVPVPSRVGLERPGAARRARPGSRRARGLVRRMERAHGGRRPHRPRHRADRGCPESVPDGRATASSVCSRNYLQHTDGP